MGLGLALLVAGGFLRFVLGRYASVQGAYDGWGTLLMALGLLSMAAAILHWRFGTPRLVRNQAPAPANPAPAKPEGVSANLAPAKAEGVSDGPCLTARRAEPAPEDASPASTQA